LILSPPLQPLLSHYLLPFFHFLSPFLPSLPLPPSVLPYVIRHSRCERFKLFFDDILLHNFRVCLQNLGFLSKILCKCLTRPIPTTSHSIILIDLIALKVFTRKGHQLICY
jgi:hypothetical protein